MIGAFNSAEDPVKSNSPEEVDIFYDSVDISVVDSSVIVAEGGSSEILEEGGQNCMLQFQQHIQQNTQSGDGIGQQDDGTGTVEEQEDTRLGDGTGNVEQKGQTETQRRMWITLSFQTLATACQIVSSALIPKYTDFYSHPAQFDAQSMTHSMALPSVNLGLSFASLICVCLSTSCWTMPSQLREYFRILAYLIVFLVRLSIFILACLRLKIVVSDLSCVPFIFELLSTLLEIRHAAPSRSRCSEIFSQAVGQNLGGNIDLGRLLAIINDLQAIVEQYIEAALAIAAVICILAQTSVSVLMSFDTHKPVEFMLTSFGLAFITMSIVWILNKWKSFNSSVTSRDDLRLIVFSVMTLIRGGMSVYAFLSVVWGIPVYNLDFTCIPFVVELCYIYRELRLSEDSERVASAELRSPEGSERVASAEDSERVASV